MVRIWSLGSSSRGNSFLIECGETTVLVDAGFSARELERKLRSCGVEPAAVDAILISHEHVDHIRGAGRFAHRNGARVFCSPKVVRAVAGEFELDWSPLAAGEDVLVGGIRVHPFSVPHDAADPFGLRIEADGLSIAVCTDLGVPTPLVEYNLARSNVWLLESNHDPDMLVGGPYPWHLKQRIASEFGHLSNRAAAELIGRNAHDGLVAVMLVHISETNNDPSLAYAAAAEALGGNGLKLEVAHPTEPVKLLEI